MHHPGSPSTVGNKEVNYDNHDRRSPTATAPRARAETQCRHERIIEWFDRWRKPIRGWLRNRRSVPPSDVDDLAQEVFLRLLRYGDDVAVENPQGYLFRIACNVANEWHERSQRRCRYVGTMDEVLIESEEEPDNVLEQARIAESISAALEQLPPRRREVLLLHVNEGMTYKQIARQRGLTHRVVVRDLSRAYSALRLQLKREDL